MKITKAITALVLGVFIGAPALASETYVLDPGHTQVVFSVERFGFINVISSFSDVSGEIVLDQDAPQNSSVTARVGTASLWSGGNVKREKHVKSDKWLNAVDYPEISLSSTKVTLDGENKAVLEANMTMFGQTHPVTFKVTMNKIGMDPATKKQAAGFSLRGSLKRSDFGSKTALGFIGDEIKIYIEALAHLKE